MKQRANGDDGHRCSCGCCYGITIVINTTTITTTTTSIINDTATTIITVAIDLALVIHAPVL
jgi:hypothetical protein